MLLVWEFDESDSSSPGFWAEEIVVSCSEREFSEELSDESGGVLDESEGVLDESEGVLDESEGVSDE
jgi:hypothetical protein